MTIDADTQKRLAGEAAAALVESGMRLGVGTGSTAAHFVRALAARMKDGLSVSGVPTSESTAALMRELGIPVLGLADVDTLDLAVDGADEADPDLALIKGGGAAHLREKVVARCAKRFVVIADGSKLVPVLGTFKLPVEVVPFALPAVLRELAGLGARCTVRVSKTGTTVLTDNGNIVVDADFFPIHDPAQLATRLDGIPGIAEHGLFVGMAERLIMGMPDGSVRTVFPRAR